jgi:hypothetical protein
MWFHYGCVGLEKEPKGKWFCPDCRALARKASALASKSKVTAPKTSAALLECASNVSAARAANHEVLYFGEWCALFAFEFSCCNYYPNM